MPQKTIKKTSMGRMLIFKILLVHLSVLLLTLTANFLLLYRISRKDAIENAYVQLEYAKQQLDGLCANITDMTRLLSQDKDILEFLATPRTDGIEDVQLRIRVGEKLSQLIRSYSYVKSMTLFQHNGAILNVSPWNFALGSGQASLPIQNSAAMKRLDPFAPMVTWGGTYKHNQMVPGAVYSQDRGYVVAMLIPLANYWHADQPAILSVNVSLEYFNFIALNASHGSSISLLGEGGTVLYHTGNSDNVNLGEDMQSWQLKGNFKRRQKGKRVQAAYRSAGRLDWYLVKEIPYAEIMDNIVRLESSTGITFLLSILLVVAISYLIVRKMVRHLSRIVALMSDIGSGELEKRLPDVRYLELSRLSLQFNEMMERIQVLHQKNVAHEQERRLLEIEALQAQINPHFLYNSLTTIRWMATMARANNVSQAILALNNVLHPVFAQKSILWPLASEKSFLENYIHIMEYRFGESIFCSYQIPENLLQAGVIRFLLQPVVENAVLHGLRGKEGGRIEIAARQCGGLLFLTVTDSGVGIPEKDLQALCRDLRHPEPNAAEKSGQRGFGLYNINRRILLQYGREYGLAIESEENCKTVVSICIPIRSGEDNPSDNLKKE